MVKEEYPLTSKRHQNMCSLGLGAKVELEHACCHVDQDDPFKKMSGSVGFVDIHFSTNCVCHLNGSFWANVGHSGDCKHCFSSRDYNLHVS